MASVILQVDDDPRLPDGVSEALQREGYDVLHTADPEETMRLVAAAELSLVVIEIELEDCDGLDLLRGICAARASASELPVLVLTRAQLSSGLHGEAIALGVTDFLSKPVLASQLLASIHELAPPPPPEPEPPPPPPAPEPAIDLTATPLPELAARLHRRGASGVLIASRGGARIGLELRNGTPVAFSSGGQRRARAPDEVTEASAAEDRRRAEDELLAAFGWADGSARFAAGGRLRGDAAVEIARDPADLLLAGVLAATPPELARDRLHKRASLYVSAMELEGDAAAGLTHAQRRTLAALAGQTTLAELIGSKAFEERLLYGLWIAGRLALHAAPTLDPLDDLQPAPARVAARAAERVTAPVVERVVARAAERVTAPVAARVAAPDPAPQPPPPVEASRVESVAPETTPEAEREALVHSVRELGQQVMSGDDFEALDVPLFAPDAQVRGAYDQILARLPEPALVADDPDLRERVTRIRERAEAAYENLKDGETRRAYALLRQEDRQDEQAGASASRALEADDWFRKGQRLLEAKRYEEATEAFGMASHLDPEQGEYRSHLGYALYLSNPTQSVVQREATEHIANGIKRSPDRELSYVFLGRILRARGETDAARKVFRRALRIKPDCHAAHQELRLLEMREEKSRRLISRLWRR